MNRGSVRWIAIAVAGAMVAAVAVGLLGGATPDAGDDGSGDGAGPAPGSGTEILEGPHAIVELCTGVACPAPDEQRQQALLVELEDDARVASAELITSDQAYEMFLDRFGDQQDLVEQVDPEEVPARIELDLFDPESVAELVQAYQGHDGIARVIDARTVDP